MAAKKSKKAKASKPKAGKKNAAKKKVVSKNKAKAKSTRGAGRKPAASKGKQAGLRGQAQAAAIARPVTTKMEDKGTQELNHSGWVHAVRHEAAQAEADFRKAIQGSKSVFAQYGLGKALLEQGKKDEAIRIFEDVARQLEGGALKEDKVRSDMLRRQCLGYIQLAKTGQWDLGEMSGALPS
jgi:hypothetical protein